MTKSRLAIEQEAKALKESVEAFANEPRAGCTRETDARAWRIAHHRFGAGRRRLALSGQQQARLMLANAYDHLVTMGRALGSDGAFSLFAHTTLSRGVCEASVRLAWLLDSSVTYETRIARSAAALLASADNRLQGARAIPIDRLDSRLRQYLVDTSEDVQQKVYRLVDSAGFQRNFDRQGKKVASVELVGQNVKVPVKLDIGPLMAVRLPESPSWYSISSGVAHSAAWALESAVAPNQADSNLELKPDLMEIAGAAETVISASALVIRTYAEYYGHDPELGTRGSLQRRELIDRLMIEYRGAVAIV